jgi:CitMHS family citrate-Mg2+:H+ or citrate-Ca2+:H+ symporter
MLAAFGFATIIVFLVATMTRRVSVLIALVLVPVGFALIAASAGVLPGGAAGLGKMMLDGVVKVAPVGVMIIFAVLYFGMMLDLGLFDPVIRVILRVAGGDPLKVAVATAVLTMLVALDGDGATTFLITISAMLPLYQRLGMSRLVLSGIICLAAGVMNIIPWGGPTARAMATLKVDASAIFNPVVPAMAVGILWVLAVAAYLGLKERRRLGVVTLDKLPALKKADAAGGMQYGDTGRRVDVGAGRMWFNAGLTLALVVALLMALLPLAVLFIVAFVIALWVNFPAWEDQQKQLLSHANSVVTVSSMIFAAGIFTGVLTGTKMIEAMAQAAVAVVPESMAGYLPVIVAITSMPLSLVFPPDAFYFGVLPVLAQTAAGLGIDPVAIGRAAILGQMTTGFPLSPLTASTFILIGLSGVTLGDHQRFVFKWAFGTTLVMTVVAVLTGAIPI